MSAHVLCLIRTTTGSTSNINVPQRIGKTWNAVSKIESFNSNLEKKYLIFIQGRREGGQNSGTGQLSL